MATTTNYGWTTPDDTALVKDGASAIRTLGSSIDTSLKSLNAGTTAGDLDYYTSSTAKARIGIGTSGQVLSVSGGVPAWTSLAGSSQSWSLVNAGGTALTGAQTITVSGISGANQLFVFFTAASSASASSQISLRLNGDTAGNYYWLGPAFIRSAAYSSNVFDSNPLQSAQTLIPLGQMNSNATNYVSGSALITGANSSGLKVFNANGSVNTDGNGGTAYFNSGYYNSSSTISSVSIVSGTGNFDNGTIYIYKTA